MFFHVIDTIPGSVLQSAASLAADPVAVSWRPSLAT